MADIKAILPVGKAAFEKVEEPKDTRKGFFVAAHPYEFKLKTGVLKPNKSGSYIPKNEAEKEALQHFAARGFITFLE